MNRYLTAAAIKHISQLLHLPFDEWESRGGQDWDIELADSSRVREFCNHYSALQDTDERFALMKLILASYDEQLASQGPNPVIETEVIDILKRDWDLHEDTVAYWALVEGDWVDGFLITPMMKRLWIEMNVNQR